MKAYDPIRIKAWYKTILGILTLSILLATNCFCDEIHKLCLFDKIITKEILVGKDVGRHPFYLEVKEEYNARNYIFTYIFDKTTRNQHYICSISVAKAGTFIDPKQYEEEYVHLKAELLKTSPERWKQQLRIDFPEIGRRARWGHITAGPGGASYDLRLTTSDGIFDIKIIISNLMPDTIESPDLDIEQIARAISDHYNKIDKLTQ